MVILKSPQEIDKIAISGLLISKALEYIVKMVKPGITTLELNKAAEDYLLSRGAKPAFKGFKRDNNTPAFPASLCTSINDEVVHGIPSSKRVLKNGDIISLDLGVGKDGYYADAAVTVPVGEITQEAKRLLEVTKTSLMMAISKAIVGNRIQDLSYTVQSYAENNGYSVVRDFVGHGIGREPHEEPQVPNFGKPGKGKRLMPGMVLAIEPMINLGKADVRILDDKWTAVTADGCLSAHYEHTIAITNDGPIILTKGKDN